jgi:hypothetical protein
MEGGRDVFPEACCPLSGSKVKQQSMFLATCCVKPEGSLVEGILNPVHVITCKLSDKCFEPVRHKITPVSKSTNSEFI